jgi:hypothetical protein
MLTRSPPPRKRRPLQPLYFDVDAQEQGEEVGIRAHATTSEPWTSVQKRQRLHQYPVDGDATTIIDRDQTDGPIAGATPLHVLRTGPSIVDSTLRTGAAASLQLATPAGTLSTGGRGGIFNQHQNFRDYPGSSGRKENARLQLVPSREAPQFEHDEGLCCTYQCTNLVKREFIELLEEQKRSLSSCKQQLASERQAKEEAQSESASLVLKVRECRGVIASAQAREAEIQHQRREEVIDREERWRQEAARVKELQVWKHTRKLPDRRELTICICLV